MPTASAATCSSGSMSWNWSSRRCAYARMTWFFRSFLQQTPGGENIERKIEDQSLSLLKSYSWPGNIWELHNVCARFFVLFSASGENVNITRTLRECIGSDRFLDDILYRYKFKKGSKQVNPAMLKELTKALGYKKEQLEELIGISRTTLWRLEKESFD